MKSALSLALFAFILLACGKTENAFDKLSEEERDALRARAQAKCLGDNSAKFETFKRESAESMFGEEKFRRNKSFKYTFGKDGDSSPDEGSYQVWTRGADFIVFHVVQPDGDYFLRLTKTQHDEMIEDLKEDFCARAPIVFETGAGITDSTANFTLKYTKTTSGTEISEYLDTYTVYFSEPLFFASYHLKRSQSKRTIDEDGNVGDPVDAGDYTSTLSDHNLNDFNRPYTSYTQLFCEYDIQTPPGKYRVSNIPTDIGYKFPTDSGNTPDPCVGTLPVTWNMAINNN